MYPNWKFSKIDLNSPWQCDEIQNNCDKCGKLYRYNWRRRRTRDKTCNLCVNEVKCNVVLNIKGDPNTEPEPMNFDSKPPDDNLCLEKRTWDTPLSMFHFTDSAPPEPRNIVSDSMKKVFGFQEFTDQLLFEMKADFGEELRNPQKPPKTDFEWPSTSQLSKVDCLRAFNIMKQILLREMGKLDEVSVSDPLVLRRKFYLERRFQSLEREKIRRLKIYESLYVQEERCPDLGEIQKRRDGLGLFATLKVQYPRVVATLMLLKSLYSLFRTSECLDIEFCRQLIMFCLRCSA